MAKKDSLPPGTQPMPNRKIILPLSPISADPQGSYTGRPVDPMEQPVQDADDL